MKKKLSIILACIMLVGVLGGCGNSFDASSYLKALLDNYYKNDSSQMVSMKIATAEEAAEYYKDSLDVVIDGITSSVGNLSEEQKEEYRKVFADVFKGAKYTVGEAEKQDDGSFVVTVSYEQMNVYEPAMTAYLEMVYAKAEEWQTAAENGEEIPSSSERVEWVAMALKDCIEDSLNSVTYDEAQEVTVKISLQNNVWTPNSSDIEHLEEVFFDLNDAFAIFN